MEQTPTDHEDATNAAMPYVSFNRTLSGSPLAHAHGALNQALRGGLAISVLAEAGPALEALTCFSREK